MSYTVDMSYYQPQAQDMSSYIAVQGTPWEDACQVFGLTPRELRYLKVYCLNNDESIDICSFQMKFMNTRRPSDPTSSPLSNLPHGASLPTSPVVVLNALGYIGFKVISTCGSSQVSNFTVEGLLIRRRTLAVIQ